jgi:Kef-type K+ transport system membrane component KefB
MHDIPELDAKGLRHFGLLTGGIVAGLFGLVLPWLFSFAYPIWPWVAGGTLAVWATVAPRSLRPVYRVWMRFGLLLNRITTPIILGTVYYVIITPTGAIMRLLRRDAMGKRYDHTTNSYRIPSKKPPKQNLEKPF